MSRPTVRPAFVAVVLVALGLAGCGRGATGAGTSSTPTPPLGTAQGGKTTTTQSDLGFPVFATKNTTRIPSADPVQAAAGVARAVYPGLSVATRPAAVAIVDKRDWRTALAASVLMSDPVKAPLLFSDGGQALPAASQSALTAMSPRGSAPLAGAQVVRVGSVPRPAGLKTTDISGRDPFSLALGIDQSIAAARGKTTDAVLVVSAEQQAFAAPAAAYAAKAGVPILFARRSSVPAATITAIKTHQQPKIYVLGPAKVIGTAATAALRKLGTVQRIGGADPVTNAIAFARFSETNFGWGVVDPGHGLVFARSSSDPALFAAAAPLSASGTYGPLLLLSDPDTIDPALATYLQSIQPGYRADPVRGVYNHGWLVGDPASLSPAEQARLDTLLEIMPETTTSTGTTQ